MSHFPVPLAAVGLFAAVTGSSPLGAAGDRPGTQFAQFAVQQRIVVRVHRAAPQQPVTWREKKGPKCVPLDGLAGAVVVDRGAVDLVLAGGERVRARLESHCPALNFYAGFYLKPNRDNRVCADRDAVHSRSGRSCRIHRFKRLVAAR